MDFKTLLWERVHEIHQKAEGAHGTDRIKTPNM